MIYFMILSFFAGMAVIVQANVNAHVSQILSSSVLATLCTFVLSALIMSLIVLGNVKLSTTFDAVKTVPIYLWLIMAGLSSFALLSFYFVLPKIGALSMVSYSLCGQLLISMVMSHYGWLNMPISQITIDKIIGVLAMIIGIFLINRG